jgi:hypothetical protein
MAIRITLTIPKNKLKAPSALLVAVKYSSIAPIINMITPKNFSASDAQKVSSPSLIVVFALSFHVNGYIKQEGYFKLFVLGSGSILL